MEIKGSSLAKLLNNKIDSMVTDDKTRSDVIASAASAAGISASTLNQILGASIVCPPMRRLEGLAKGLSISLSSLVAAAKRDGCMVDEAEKSIYSNLDKRLENIETLKEYF